MTAIATALSILPGAAEGPIVVLDEALSFWGGVDPVTGRIIDVHHPQHGASLDGAVVLMPTSRGSCSGSGVLLELALAGRAPAAFIFSETEDVLTLGALVATEMFERTIPVLRLSADGYGALAKTSVARVTETEIEFSGFSIPVIHPPAAALDLRPRDRAMLDGNDGPAVQQAMRIICAMALQQGATQLIDVTRGHIDGCIYASAANLTFAETMEALGAKVRIPTTMNAISVDLLHWQAQGVPPAFGGPASRLAESYVRMGCSPTFTCSPYLLDDRPETGESIAWSESNAVIFANSVFGARTAKHPDFLDLCIALTARAPLSGAYLDENRKAQRIIDVDLPEEVDDAVWPLIGYLAGHAAPDRISLLRGLAGGKPSQDNLKALCAAFGTTSAAPMLHIEGVTPEADGAAGEGADRTAITRAQMIEAYAKMNVGPEAIELVAIGSPHASLSECRDLAAALEGKRRSPDVAVIVTAGRQVITAASADGTLARLQASGVEVLADLCWCSISRPVFPTRTRTVMTNSGKYAHYGPGLSGCAVRFGTLDDCVEAAVTGRVPPRRPAWLC